MKSKDKSFDIILYEMNILHISKYYHPYRGGIEKVIKELSEAAVKKGHQVTVLCASEHDNREESFVNGVRVVRLPLLFTVFSQPITTGIFSDLKKEIEKCEIINIHTPNPLYELALLMTDTKKPIIITYHCEVYKARALNNIYQPISQALMKRASKIVVGTTFHMDHSRGLQAYKDKCAIIPFGLEPKYSKLNKNMDRHLKTIQNKYGSYFLFAGRMVAYNGVNVLLKALVHAQDIKVVLIGSGKMLESWKSLSHKLKVDHQAHFVGAITDDEEFAAYMHGCRALVLPSVNEAEVFGLVLLEALSCSKPVLTTNLNSSVRFVNKAGETGIMVPVADEFRMAEALQKLQNDDILHMKMSKNAGEHFQEHFLISACLAKYEAIYKTEVAKAA